MYKEDITSRSNSQQVEMDRLRVEIYQLQARLDNLSQVVALKT